jgi:hypothetical protein
MNNSNPHLKYKGTALLRREDVVREGTRFASQLIK